MTERRQHKKDFYPLWILLRAKRLPAGMFFWPSVHSSVILPLNLKNKELRLFVKSKSWLNGFKIPAEKGYYNLHNIQGASDTTSTANPFGLHVDVLTCQKSN